MSSSVQAAADRPLHVLVVEDHPVNQKLVITALQRLGHTGVLAPHGESALRCLARHRFDLVLMDVSMPVMSGLEALARIRAEEQGGARRLPVILVTANDLPGDRERFLLQGADGYLAKPVRAETIRAEIARMWTRLASVSEWSASLPPTVERTMG